MASMFEKWGPEFVERHSRGRTYGLGQPPIPAWFVTRPQGQSHGPNTTSGNAARSVRMPGIFDKAR